MSGPEQDPGISLLKSACTAKARLTSLAPMRTKSKRSTKIPQQEEARVRLRIICLSPPNPEAYGAAFGLQDNSTTKEWVIHPGKSYPDGDVHFECECRVRRNHTSPKPNFLGPFAQGGIADRF